MSTLASQLSSVKANFRLGLVFLLISVASPFAGCLSPGASVETRLPVLAQLSDSPASARCQGELFEGSSEDKDGSFGWIFCLEKDLHSGSIYEPPGMLKLRETNWDKLGSVEFLSVPFTGDHLYYSFQGKLEGSELRGILRRMKESTAKPEKEYQVRASKLEANDGDLKSAQRFSNVKYVPEAGALVGAELLLLQKEPCRGILSFYSSYWGEPTYTPLLVTNLNETGKNSAQFSLRYNGTTRSYSLTFSGQSAFLSPKTTESWQTPKESL